MMLLDSNIIIYAAKPEYSHLCDLIAKNSPVLSAVSYVEVLGYHRLMPLEKSYFEAFFKAATVLPIINSTAWKTVTQSPSHFERGFLYLWL